MFNQHKLVVGWTLCWFSVGLSFYRLEDVEPHPYVDVYCTSAYVFAFIATLRGGGTKMSLYKFIGIQTLLASRVGAAHCDRCGLQLG